jgi:phytoene synthase
VAIFCKAARIPIGDPHFPIVSQTQQAEQITERSNSNLALSFFMLPARKRRDITVFYAFCRVIDDLVDSNARSEGEKIAGLRRWREVTGGEAELTAAEAQGLAGDLRRVIRHYRISPQLFENLIDGVEMDLSINRYSTWLDLKSYCYRVASVVGLISIEIFGYTHPRTRDYAVKLGYALQLTNILRDVDKDRRLEGRIYLPIADLDRFGVTEESLLAGRPEGHFTELMRLEAQRAWDFFREARELLPPQDRRAMAAAEMMRITYKHLLTRMERDGFRVFEKEYRLNKISKAGLAATSVVKSRLGW